MYFSKVENGPYTYLNYAFKSDDLIQYQLKMINGSEQNIFLKQKKEDGLVIDITSLVPINVFFRSCETFERKKYVLSQIIEQSSKAEEYLLDINKIILDQSSVYVDVGDLSIKFIYIPLRSYQHKIQKKMKDLLLNLLFTIDIEEIESDDRLKHLIGYLQDIEFDMFVFSSMLKTLKHKENRKEQKWFKRFFKKDISENKLVRKDETILLDEEKSYPVLEFQDKSVIINKASFLIGRAPQLVDYAIPEQLSLGRVHAEFIQEKDECYIIDINTKNGTFINGKRLVSQKKYVVSKGDSIELAGKKATLK